MKAFEKLHSSMLIKWSFDLLFDSGQLKMSWNCIFVYCFIEGSVSILNDIGSWTLAWTMVLTYIFIFWTRIGERSTLDPPSPYGVTPTQKIEEKNQVIQYIKWKLLENSIQICPSSDFVWTLFWAILWNIAGGEWTVTQPKYLKKKYLVMWHIKWDPLRNL